MDRLGNRPGVDHLLPAESNLAEMRLAEIEDCGRRADADGRFESLGNGAIGMRGDLLGQHDIEERGESRGSAARRRRADFGDGAGKVGVAAGERAQGRG